jgi:hypothetical protein
LEIQVISVLLTVFLKGLSHEIFRAVFWPVWIDLGLDMNRFWFLSFKEAPSILRQAFLVLMRFLSNLLGDSKNLREGLATESAVLRDLFKFQASFIHANVVVEYSWRTEDSVANPSPITGDSVANPSQRF